MTKRFEVIYTRQSFKDFGYERVRRDIYAQSYKNAVRATQRLPRFAELVSCTEIAPESEAEAAARVARENNGPVPRGC